MLIFILLDVILVVFISFDTIEGVIGNHSFVLGLYLIFDT
jgi:hypothetical protein